jgi:hypothetical protein
MHKLNIVKNSTSTKEEIDYSNWVLVQMIFLYGLEIAH